MGVITNYSSDNAFDPPDTNTVISAWDAAYGEGTVADSLSGIPSNSEINEAEGIFSGMKPDGTSGFLTSRNYIRTIDLISEGPIEGLVSGDYTYQGNRYETGWQSANYNSWGSTPESWLKSVYYNDVPIVNDGDLYNFQQVKVAFADGTPQGIREGDNFLNSDSATQTQKTRVVNERIHGPDILPNGNGKKYYPKYYKFYNANASKINLHLKIPALKYTKFGDSWPADEQGKVIGTSVTFAVRHRAVFPNGATGAWYRNTGVTLEGLLSSPYVHKYSINLSDAETGGGEVVGWEIEVTRTTLDSIDQYVQNQSFVDTITEVFESQLSFPNSSVISTFFNAEYFSSIPNRAFDVKLLKVKVPVGYDPIKRTYAATWNGNFQSEKKWTDNPAWVFYDLVTNKRYGLGRYIKEINLDKWTLYKIAQYCDVLVDDGEGDLEPRFSCNVYINTKEEAFKVLQDFASIFRGIVYYGLGDIHAVQDREKDPVIQFNNTNVIEGNFTYSSSAKKTRYSIAIVRYNDKNNFYKPAIEYVEDVDAIRKYGVREKEVTAFGCTSKGQAIRLGRWLLHTNSIEQETITFSAGLDALLLRPGDLIQVADKNRGLNLDGGRIVSLSNTGVVLDRKINFGDFTYSLNLTTPTYHYENRNTNLSSTNIDDIRRSHIQKVNFVTGDTSNYPISNTIIGSGAEGPIEGTVIGFPNGKVDSVNYNISGGEFLWTLDDNQYEPEYYNVLNIKENADLSYEVHGSKHFTGKYLYIESGILTAPRDPGAPSSSVPPPAPASIAGSVQALSTNSKKIQITITKPDPIGTTNSYAIFLKTGSAWDSSSFDTTHGDFQQGTTPLLPRDNLRIATISQVSDTSTVSTEYIPRHNNTDYYLLAYAINDVGIYSSSYSVSSKIEVTDHFPVRDVQIHSLRLTSDGSANNASEKTLLAINPPSKDQYFTWNASFLSSAVPNIPIEYSVTIRKPSSNNTPDSTIHQTFIEQDQTFAFPFEKNYANTNNGPHRHYDIVVEAVNPLDGSKSTDGGANGYDILEIHNQRPSGYWIDPRDKDSERPIQCASNSLLCTTQQITSDGKLELHIRSNSFGDLAGGNLYLSASGFDKSDFDGGLTGTPNNISRTQGAPSIDAPYRQIYTVPFESDGTSSSSVPSDKLSNPLHITPNLTEGISIAANYQQKWYMAVSFFDSFDKALREKQRVVGPETWNDGQWVAFQRPFTGSNGLLTDSDGTYFDNSDWLAGNAAPVYNGFKDPLAVPVEYWHGENACPVFPSRYYSAKSANAFHSWIRINVNGMWEGNGVSAVKNLGTEDILRYYGWPGYYEYSCEMWEPEAPGLSPARVYANQAGSYCRFTQGKLDFPQAGHTLAQGVWDQQNISLWAASDGSNQFGDNSAGAANPNMALTGKWVGVPLEWLNTDYNPNTSYNILDDELIPSYNETGKALMDPTNSEELTRPLHGFRRFRVYFDPNNLPLPSKPDGLASYSVVGLNSWNGKYDSFQGRVANDIFFAREGNNIFPQFTVGSWMKRGDLFENVPGVWNHHAAGFGQGFGGLIKTHKFFDVHLGRMIDDSYLQEGFFGVVTTNDYSMTTNFADYDNDPDWGAPTLGQMMETIQPSYVYDIDGDVEGYHPEGGFTMDGTAGGFLGRHN